MARYLFEAAPSTHSACSGRVEGRGGHPESREIDRVRGEGGSRVHWLGDGIRGNLVSSKATKLALHMLGGNATIAGLPVLSHQSGTRAVIAGWVGASDF